jgi:hypothetical protein
MYKWSIKSLKKKKKQKTKQKRSIFLVVTVWVNGQILDKNKKNEKIQQYIKTDYSG